MVDDRLAALPLTPRYCPGSELDTAQFHDLIRLRIEVFVVEQECPYAELDGLDLLPTTTHIWFADEAGPTGSLRVYADKKADGWRIGRVVTRKNARGQGLATQLMISTLGRFGQDDTALEAQSYLGDFYARFGYIQTGPEYTDEDGIPHLPMARPGQPSQHQP